MNKQFWNIMIPKMYLTRVWQEFSNFNCNFNSSGGVWEYQILQGYFAIFHNTLIESSFLNASSQKRILEWMMALSIFLSSRTKSLASRFKQTNKSMKEPLFSLTKQLT